MTFAWRHLLRWLRWCLPAFALGAALASGPAPGPRADLAAGRAFVLSIIDRQDAQLQASEAFADWQAYQARFVKIVRGRFAVHTLAPEAAREELPALATKQRNATLFVAADGRALVHEGLVLEPDVYRLGRRFVEQGEVAREAERYGLKLSTLR